MKKERRSQTVMLTECSVMLALSVVLSFVKVWEMPMGGSVTLLSMLPVLLISVKYGAKGGLSTAFVLALFQLVLGIASGNVFVYCTSVGTAAVCALFDYLLPFTVLGLGGIFCKRSVSAGKSRKTFALLLGGFAAVIALRFLCHFLTGVVIWSQWAPGGQSKYIYSLLYNGQYMLPEAVITLIGAAGLWKVSAVRRLLLPGEKKNTEN